MTAATLDVRGSGGVVLTVDVPKPGTLAHERLVEQIVKGYLTVVDGAEPVEQPDGATKLQGGVGVQVDEALARITPEPVGDDDGQADDDVAPAAELTDEEREEVDILKAEVPDGTIDDVTAWVDEVDSERRLRKIAALEVEQAADKPRKSLLDQLSD